MDSPRRKRARRAVASVSSAVKHLAAEKKKITFKFVEGGSVHSLPWTELLTMDETLFESVDDLIESVNVMAPWYDDGSLTIQHAQAIVIKGGKKSSSSAPRGRCSPVQEEPTTAGKSTTPVKQPVRQKPRRSPRKVADKKKAEEQALRRTCASLLNQFEDNPSTECSQVSKSTSNTAVIPQSSQVINGHSSDVDLNPQCSQASDPLQRPAVTHPDYNISKESVGANAATLSTSSVIPAAMNVLLDVDGTDVRTLWCMNQKVLTLE